MTGTEIDDLLFIAGIISLCAMSKKLSQVEFLG